MKVSGEYMKQEAILVVDDMEVNRAILGEIFKDDYQIIEAENGKDALQKLAENYKSVVAVLLDIIMPVMDGFQFLELLKSKELLSRIPVILITGATSEKMEMKGYDIGVADYIKKPFDPLIIKKRVNNIVELYQHKYNLEMLVNRQTSKLEEQNVVLKRQTRQLQEINNVVIDTMSDVVEFRNLESGQHIKRIKVFTRCLAECAAKEYPEFGLTPEIIQIIEQVSAMHDIGKIAIPDRILLKPGKLTEEEFEVMKSHTTKGCEIVDSIVRLQGEEYFKYSYEICRHHHEKYDGKGYPDGLKGEEIPIAAQLVSVADVYDALVSERIYKTAFDTQTAYKMIVGGECGVFSPKMLHCLELVKKDFERLAEENKDRNVINEE